MTGQSRRMGMLQNLGLKVSCDKEMVSGTGAGSRKLADKARGERGHQV